MNIEQADSMTTQPGTKLGGILGFFVVRGQWRTDVRLFVHFR